MTQPAIMFPPPSSSDNTQATAAAASTATLPGQTPSEQRLIIGVASLLAIGAALEATTKSMLALLAPLGLPAAAIKTAVRVALSAPIGDVPPAGSPRVGASNTTASLERMFRATYLVNAAKRIARDMRAGGKPLDIIRRERNIFNMHLSAQGNRREKARLIDRTAAKFGPTLGWYAVMDARTSAECRWANGRNFRVDKRPPIGYPGTVHPNCRCTPGKPHATEKSVYNQPKSNQKAV